MKKLIFYLVVIALLSSCNTRDGNILHIEEQGSFAVGGTILTDSLGRNYHGDHAYVFYQKPVMHANTLSYLHTASVSSPRLGKPRLTDEKDFKISSCDVVFPLMWQTSPDAATRDVALRPSPYHRFSMKKNGLTVSV